MMMIKIRIIVLITMMSMMKKVKIMLIIMKRMLFTVKIL